MLRRQGYRFRLKPTHADAASLRRFLGCSRFVWNALLAENTARYDLGEKRLGYTAMCERLVQLKAEHHFLREAHSQPLQQTLKDLDLAYHRACDPKLAARFPCFKKKGRAAGMRFPQGVKIDGSGVYLPKIGWIGFRKSREVEGTIKNVTVSFDGHDWSVTFQAEREIEEPIHTSESAVGIDLGVARFAALSDGTFVEGVNALKHYQRRLAWLQRRMARKVKFSANWRKAKTKVSRLYRKIANIRSDMLHKASTTISKNHAFVAMEDLRITNMTTSAKGTLAQPGRNVRAKSGLNRRILDQGWGEFRRQMEYKLQWRGGTLVLVDAKDTSRTCGHRDCRHVSKDNRKTQAVFICVKCGYAANADTNAAVEILGRAGWARIARGDSPLGGSVKREAQLVA